MTEYKAGTRAEDVIEKKKINGKTREKLLYWEDLTYEITGEKDTFFDLLNQGAQAGESVRSTSRQLEISHVTLIRILRTAQIPIRTQAEAVRAMLDVRWQDLEFRKRQAEAARANWDDPEFRKRNVEATRAMLDVRWQDLEFRKRQAEGVRAMLDVRWKDPEFRKRQAEATRKARLKEENQGRYKLPTIQGERRDIGYAHSAWEANIARILRQLNREALTHQTVTLSTGEKQEIDFVTLNQRNTLTCYEIMAHPLEDPQGWNKLVQAQEENPHLRIHPITARTYQRLQKRFQERINANPDLCGWEETHDNLKTNPQKYA